MIGKISLSIKDSDHANSKGLHESDLVKVVLIQHSIKGAEYMMYLIGKLNIINQVFWIRDSQEALNILEGNEYFKKGRFTIYPKLIICDLDMPDQKKIHFLENIKEFAHSDRISLAFLLSSIEEKGLFEKAGLTRYKYLFKPINLAMLKQVVLRSDRYFILPTYWEHPEIDIMYRMTK